MAVQPVLCRTWSESRRPGFSRRGSYDFLYGTQEENLFELFKQSAFKGARQYCFVSDFCHQDVLVILLLDLSYVFAFKKQFVNVELRGIHSIYTK